MHAIALGQDGEVEEKYDLLEREEDKENKDECTQKLEPYMIHIQLGPLGLT